MSLFIKDGKMFMVSDTEDIDSFNKDSVIESLDTNTLPYAESP